MQPNYSNILKRHQIAYITKDHWLQSYTIGRENDLNFYISACVAQATTILEIVFKYVKEINARFRVIKDVETHYQLNGGFFGSEGIGKVITIWPDNYTQAQAFLEKISPALLPFKGPSILQNSYGLGVIYLPFLYKDLIRKLGKAVHVRYPEKSLIVGRYIPVKMLKYSPKGNVYKGHSIRGLKFNPCLIKEGRPYMAEDSIGRYAKDRLNWEKCTLEALVNIVPVPRVMDFLERKGNCYLIMEWIEGDAIGDVAARIGKEQKLALLADIVSIVMKLHKAGYIHRDLNENNFIVSGQELHLIDLEIAYDVKSKKPTPAFFYGMPGYAAPEQQQHTTPTFAEDIYSIGMLAFTLLTGKSVRELVPLSYKYLESQLLRIKLGNAHKVICRCFDITPNKRPLLTELLNAIKSIEV